MKGKYVFLAWAATVVVGSLSFVPALAVTAYFRGDGMPATIDWVWLYETTAIAGVASGLASIPATLLLYAALRYFRSQDVRGTALLFNLLRCQLALAVLTFGCLFYAEPTADDLFWATVPVYSLFGALSLTAFFYRSQRLTCGPA